MQRSASFGLCTFTVLQQLDNKEDREQLQTAIMVYYGKSVQEKEPQ
jgi:hypothetical protein